MKAHLKTHDPNRGNIKIEEPQEELLNVTDWNNLNFGAKNDEICAMSSLLCIDIYEEKPLFVFKKYTLLTGQFLQNPC